MAPNGAWSGMRFSGAGVERARLVVLSNGRVALVRPPEEGDLSTARLTLTDGATDGARATHLPLRMPPVGPDVAHALRLGIWMDGFEERRPGVLGGWIDAGGSLLGIEIALDGEVRAGEYIRDAGAPIASSRWAFGWTASRGGFETTDGGMSWTKEIALPEPIAEPRAGRDRSCGPIGCVTAGWLRIGWGPAGATEASAPPEPPPPRPRFARRSPNLTLDCEPIGPRPPAEPAATQPGRRPLTTLAQALQLQPHSPARGLSASASWGAVSQFRPFGDGTAPLIPPGDLGISIDASHPVERGLRPRPLARAYAWGPSSGDWDPPGRWQVRWVWPWAGPFDPGSDSRSSAISPAPWASLEQAARAFASSMGGTPEWTLVPGDDADHALLIEHRAGLTGTGSGGSGVALEVLEAERSPIDVKRDGGEPLPELQGAVRTGGRWYVATAQVPGEPAAAILWLLDGGVAREIGRVARVAPESSGPARLARKGGNAVGGAASAVGFVVTGQDPDRGATLWVSSFDTETHAFGDPEPLAPVNLSDRTVVPCSSDDGGWEVEAPFPGTVDVRVGPSWSSRLQGVVARLRVSRTAACVDGVFASADGQGTGARSDDAIWSGHPPGTRPRGARSLVASVVGERTRIRLRCWVPSP